MPRLIGIAGLKTAGKDTTFQNIKELEDCTVKRAAFADKLKIMAMLALGYEGSPAYLIDQANKLKESGVIKSYYEPMIGTRLAVPVGHSITGRQYLQSFGACARLVFGENFWVDQVLPDPGAADGRDWLAKLEEIIDPWTGGPRGAFDILCVTDVRYSNEAERILALNGEVWEVQRPGLKSDGHSSEQPLPRSLVTRTIDNSGTITDLRKEIQQAL